MKNIIFTIIPVIFMCCGFDLSYDDLNQKSDSHLERFKLEGFEINQVLPDSISIKNAIVVSDLKIIDFEVNKTKRITLAVNEANLIVKVSMNDLTLSQFQNYKTSFEKHYHRSLEFKVGSSKVCKSYDYDFSIDWVVLKECKDETINYSLVLIENKAFNRKIRQKL